jgi:4-amino-4-deoxy-L-arabinose transferase-like glycosyltransferase
VSGATVQPVQPVQPDRREVLPAWGATPRHGRPADRPGQVTAICVALFVVAFGLRFFHIVTSYNLFIDEVTYSEIARNIAHGHGVTEYGQPFDLHPPAVMATFGLVIRLFGLDGNLADLSFALRPVAAVFGAGTVTIAFLIVRRMGLTNGYALVAAALVALDPFQISYDSRVMLEAQTQFFTALTILLVMHLSREHSRWLLVAAGLSAGITFCSKETFGLVLGAALIVIAYSNRLARRKELFSIIGISLAAYVANLVMTIWTGGLHAWMQARGNGLTRLIGMNKETGFNSPTVKVSLVSRLTANLDQLAVTYGLLLLGGLCCLALIYRMKLWRPAASPFRSEDREATVVVAWALTACGYLVYATGLGSIEEQMYYIPLLPCILALITLLSKVRKPWMILVAAFLAIDTVVWSQVHSVDSNTYRAFFSWARTGIPKDSRVAVTEDSAQFVLSGLDLGNWHTAQALQDNHVDYVLINPELVEQGYGVGDPAFLSYLKTKATTVFRATSKQDGTLILYDVRKLDRR